MNRLILMSFSVAVFAAPLFGQIDNTDALEQRQPLELVFADSIVPQGDREMMLTTGTWYSRRRPVNDGKLTQKVEWGISDKLQISAFANPLHLSNVSGRTVTGTGDFDVGARYTWVNVGSPFTHVALAMEAAFPSGDPLTGMGEGMYGLSPSVLLSHEFKRGRFQAFSTTGVEFVVANRHLNPLDDVLHHELSAIGGLSARAGHGWMAGELSVRSDRWSGGDETQIALAPSYVWRLARRTELLFSIPIGLTSSTSRIGAVVKFTFELGGEEAR